MITREYLVRRALEHSHRSVGYAFCKALGVLHLVGRKQWSVRYEEPRIDGLMECFNNTESPMDKVFA